MAARAAEASSVLHSIFENTISTTKDPQMVYQNHAAKTNGVNSFAELLGTKVSEAIQSLREKGNFSTVVQHHQRWYKLQADVAGNEIVVCENDISDIMVEQERKDQQFRRVCHDLRAPLHGIVGLSENIIVKAKRARSSTTDAMAILHEGQRLAFMINDILDSSKLRAGKMELHLCSLSIREAVEKVVHSLRSAKDQSTGNSIVATDVALRNEVSDSMPYVQADKHRLSQILYNIIGNACKFTKKGSVRVIASTLTDTTSGDFVQIHVKDTGAGIKDSDIGKLFQEFVQVDDTGSQEFAGTGLGLAICKELVELHGGTMMVDSVYGSGSTFSFTLPATTEEPAPEVQMDDSDLDAWIPSNDELDDLFGGDGTWGTGSFRYGTGAVGSGRYDKLMSLMKQASFLKDMSLRSAKSSRTNTVDHGGIGTSRTSKELLQQMTDLEREAYLKRMYRWFVGSMDRYEAARVLEAFPIGSFLVRKGTRDYVISVRYMRNPNQETLFNVEIHTCEEPHPIYAGVKVKKYYVADSTKFSDLPTLVEYYMSKSELFFSNLADARDYHNERLLPCESVEEVFH